MRSFQSLSGAKITVVGLGHFGGGVGVTRWLAGQGARVTVTDMAPAEKLADSVASIKDLPVTLHLGGHEESDFTQADLLVVNPAVPKQSPLIQAAARAGVPRTSEINLFLERCPARVVGITGSVGKSTTTAMIGRILAKRFTTHVGGNIGGSLLDDLDNIRPDHVVVLELSSFQLEDLPLVGVSPHVAVVTNIKPNHLDRHGRMDAYADAKKNIFRFQKPVDVLVLNKHDAPTAAWASEACGRVVFFDSVAPGADAAAGAIATPFDLILPGAHNQANAQAAWTACQQLRIDHATAADALKDFPGLPHRLQFVTEQAGVRYFNDSKCTTPEGAIVAMESFPPGRAIIIVGGYDKHVSFDILGAALAARAKAVIAIGATQRQIVAAIQKARGVSEGGISPAGYGRDLAPPPSAAQLGGEFRAPKPNNGGVAQGKIGTVPIFQPSTFAEAVSAARSLAAPGDVVLLSPACASYDMFTNYEHRGEKFVELVKQP